MLHTYNSKDEALYYTAYNGHIECIKLLLKHGANVHVYDDRALRWASANGHVECVKLLVEHGANANANDLYCARTCGHTEITELLEQ